MKLKPMEVKKLEAERLHAFLQEMLKEDENKYCADCEAKQPRWASWNLGIFVCIRCAGIHRNLGVHISKVKSVTLDSWTPEQVQSMRIMGNAKARAVYECELPSMFRRPQTDQSLEAFIRAKYEAKKYIMKDWVPIRADVSDLPLFPASLAHDKKATLLAKQSVGSSLPQKSHSASAIEANCKNESKDQLQKEQNIAKQSSTQLIDFFSDSKPAPLSQQIQRTETVDSIDLFSANQSSQFRETKVGENLDDIFGPIVTANNPHFTSPQFINSNSMVQLSGGNMKSSEDTNFFSDARSMIVNGAEKDNLSSDLLGLDLDQFCSVSGTEMQSNASNLLKTSQSVSTGLDSTLFSMPTTQNDSKKSTNEILALFNR